MEPPQSRYAVNERAEVLPHLPAGIGSMLDVGCGSGGFGLGVRRERGPGLRIVGVEAVADQAATARGHGYDEVLEGYFPQALEGRDELFDCLVFNDVLEHMVDPWEVLRDSRRFLAPGGRALASLPNVRHVSVVQRLLRGRWDYADEGILDRTHLRFFTRATMVQMFAETGWQVESVTGINPRMDDRGRFDRLAPLVGDLRFQQFAIVARPS